MTFDTGINIYEIMEKFGLTLLTEVSPRGDGYHAVSFPMASRNGKRFKSDPCGRNSTNSTRSSK